MEFNQFVNEVKGGIKQFLPIEYEDAQVRIEEVKKLNENYLGITVLKENQVIAPTFNLNQLYKMYQSDPEISMGSILRSITELVLDVPEQFNPKSITEYENAKKKLFIRVSSAEKNEEMLQNVPHQMREDLAIEVLEETKEDPLEDDLLETIASAISKLQMIEDKYYYSLDLNRYLNNLEDDAYEE